MSSPEHPGSSLRGAGAGAGEPSGGARPPRSFKLRFAARRVPGHSRVSAVRPLTLPAPLTDKWWRAEAGGADGEREARARRRVEELFARGPRDKYPQPLLSSHEYGWWAASAARGERHVQHHVRSSEWLKGRLRVLAEEARRR